MTEIGKLKADYARCYRHFMQYPTPAMSTILKRLGAALKRAMRREHNVKG